MLTLKALLSIQVDLLCLRNLLEDILNDYSVIHAYVSFCQLGRREATHEGVNSMW